MVSYANILLCNTSNFYVLHFDEKFRFTSFLSRSLLADASTMVFILSTRFGRGNFPAMVFLRETRLKYQAATNTNSAKKRKLAISVSIIIILRPLFWSWFISLFVPRRALWDHSRLKPQVLNIFFTTWNCFVEKNSRRAQNRIYIRLQQLSEMVPTEMLQNVNSGEKLLILIDSILELFSTR